MSTVPIVASVSDLPSAVRRAEHHPESRAYVARRAAALGRIDLVPSEWGLTASVAKTVVHAVANLNWDAILHPRGRDGRFIEDGGPVDVYSGSNYSKPSLRGEAVGVRKGEDDDIITVRALSDGVGPDGPVKKGETFEIESDKVQSATPVKAKISDKAKISPSQAEASLHGPAKHNFVNAAKGTKIETAKNNQADLPAAQKRVEEADAAYAAAEAAGDKAALTKAKIARTAANKALEKAKAADEQQSSDLTSQLEQSVAKTEGDALEGQAYLDYEGQVVESLKSKYGYDDADIENYLSNADGPAFGQDFLDGRPAEDAAADAAADFPEGDVVVEDAPEGVPDAPFEPALDEAPGAPTDEELAATYATRTDAELDAAKALIISLILGSEPGSASMQDAWRRGNLINAEQEKRKALASPAEPDFGELETAEDPAIGQMREEVAAHLKDTYGAVFDDAVIDDAVTMGMEQYLTPQEIADHIWEQDAPLADAPEVDETPFEPDYANMDAPMYGDPGYDKYVMDQMDMGEFTPGDIEEADVAKMYNAATERGDIDMTTRIENAFMYQWPEVFAAPEADAAPFEPDFGPSVNEAGLPKFAKKDLYDMVNSFNEGSDQPADYLDKFDAWIAKAEKDDDLDLVDALRQWQTEGQNHADEVANETPFEPATPDDPYAMTPWDTKPKVAEDPAAFTKKATDRIAGLSDADLVEEYQMYSEDVASMPTDAPSYARNEERVFIMRDELAKRGIDQKAARKGELTKAAPADVAAPAALADSDAAKKIGLMAVSAEKASSKIDRASAEAELADILGDSGLTADERHQRMAKLMTAMALGGKQRKRYRELLDAHLGEQGDGNSAAVQAKETAANLSPDNPLKAKLQEAADSIAQSFDGASIDPTPDPAVLESEAALDMGEFTDPGAKFLSDPITDLGEGRYEIAGGTFKRDTNGEWIDADEGLGIRSDIADRLDEFAAQSAPVATIVDTPESPFAPVYGTFPGPAPQPGAIVYEHPMGAKVYVNPDGSMEAYGKDGKKKSTSATPEKLAAGHGQWKASSGADVPSSAPSAPSPAPAALPKTSGFPSDVSELTYMPPEQVDALFAGASDKDLVGLRESLLERINKMSGKSLGPGAVANMKKYQKLRMRVGQEQQSRKKSAPMSIQQVMSDLNDFDPSDEEFPNIDVQDATEAFSKLWKNYGPNDAVYTAKIGGTEKSLSNEQVRVLLGVGPAGKA